LHLASKSRGPTISRFDPRTPPGRQRNRPAELSPHFFYPTDSFGVPASFHQRAHRERLFDDHETPTEPIRLTAPDESRNPMNLEQKTVLTTGASRGHDYALTLTLSQSPIEVFNAINDTPSWWSGEIVGDTDKLNAEFTYQVAGVHFTRQRVTELVPGKKIVWHVTEAKIDFVQNTGEWKGTDLVFELERKGDQTELRFTHRGLSPTYECYDNCSSAWSTLVTGNLRRRIETGEPQPSPW
jgi:hypothetical protein